MRPLILSVVLLAGCASVDADIIMRSGLVRMAPDPADPQIRWVNVIATDAPISTSPVDPNTPAGRAKLVETLLGPNCDPPVEQSRIPMAPLPLGQRREQILMRVRCP